MAGNATGSKAAEKLKNVDHVILVGVRPKRCLPLIPRCQGLTHDPRTCVTCVTCQHSATKWLSFSHSGPVRAGPTGHCSCHAYGVDVRCCANMPRFIAGAFREGGGGQEHGVCRTRHRTGAARQEGATRSQPSSCPPLPTIYQWCVCVQQYHPSVVSCSRLLPWVAMSPNGNVCGLEEVTLCFELGILAATPQAIPGKARLFAAVRSHICGCGAAKPT